MKDLVAFRQLLEAPKRVAIIMHDRPDADALGASLGLATFLKKHRHQVSVIAPTPYPTFLNWMPGSLEVLLASQQQHAQATTACLQAADVICCVDFSALHRVHALSSSVRNATATKVVIDHHQDPEDFADLYLWDNQAAATAEIVYQIIKHFGEAAHIEPAQAECLYAGILTDTGSFKHANTTATSHLITAELIRQGADVVKVGKLIYDNNSLNRLKFLGFAISERLVVLEAYNAAYFAISKEDFQKFDLKTGDTEGLVNHALSLKGIVLAALFKENPEAVRISLRSSGNVPVDQWAKKHFGGGGHKNAAGGISTSGLAATITKFETVVKEYQSTLTTTP